MQTIFALQKPKGPTSHDIVDEVRRITGIKKVGHAGTLDPLASGVLVVGITREGTKAMHELVKREKEYIATIQLGQTSTTDDEEGEKILTENPSIPTEADIHALLPQFTGTIQQIPPLYSAVKIKGKSAYKYAREGQVLELESREVEVKEIEILSYHWPVLSIRFVTGSGVYIRSLARDIGAKLGVGGYLSDLVRTRVGEFGIDAALTLEAFQAKWKSEIS